MIQFHDFNWILIYALKSWGLEISRKMGLCYSFITTWPLKLNFLIHKIRVMTSILCPSQIYDKIDNDLSTVKWFTKLLNITNTLMTLQFLFRVGQSQSHQVAFLVRVQDVLEISVKLGEPVHSVKCRGKEVWKSVGVRCLWSGGGPRVGLGQQSLLKEKWTWCEQGVQTGTTSSCVSSSELCWVRMTLRESWRLLHSHCNG